jgi:probable phosphoglycerate mutase
MSSDTQSVALVVARHGETVWNTESRIQGHIDTDLSPRGLAQAQALANRLRDEPIAAVYSSDLKRALDTAAVLAHIRGLDLHTDARLRERSFGLFEGSTYLEAQANWPREWALWSRRDPAHAVPGGESTFQVRDRVQAFLASVLQRHAGQCVACVTHGGILDLLYRLAMGVAWETPRAQRIPNAAINRLHLAWADGTHSKVSLRVEVWADEGHLQDARDELR